MKKLLFFSVLLLTSTLVIGSSTGAGQLLLLNIGGPGTAPTPPPVCTNELDFSKACNSQYLAVVF